VLVRAARRHDDDLGRARRFFAGSLAVGALSGLLAALYLVTNGHAAPDVWWTDWLYLGYAPCAVLGTLALPRATRGPGSRLRALADGSVAVGSLWYLALVLLAQRQGTNDGLTGAERALTLAYPLVPAFVVAVMLSALPRVERRARPFLVRAAVGIALLGVSDAAFSVVHLSGGYDPASWIAAVNELGLLAILSAAMVGARPAGTMDEADEAAADVDATNGVLVVVAPYAPLVLALSALVVGLLHGRGIPPGQLWPLLLVGAAILVRHVASTRETGRLVSRIVARERAAQRQAMTDPLTGLHNRAAFLRDVDGALRDPRNHPVAVALLDLNDFKDINDTHGHDTGDEVLRHTAQRLRAAVPDGGVARLGGDEFAAYVPRAEDGGSAFADEVARAFRDPMQVGSRRFQVRPSVGVVIDERPAGSSHSGDASHLLSHADVAMYEAKRSKTLQDVPVSVLTGRARAAAAATIRIRDEVSTPDVSQLRVEYQPVVDLQTGAITGAEALVRWRHPEFGEISPAVFIPLAERVGSIGVLGDHVLRVALDDLARWTSAGHMIDIGVNVSPRQLGELSLASHVVSLLSERGLPPATLTIEVTEEALVDDMEPVVDTITALREAGVSVAVDDFGTGYSSLRYLRRFDANIVKIDREFVQASSTEPRTDALVRSVVSMAGALDLRCVAEGIETLEQLALVRAHGCQLGQGFLLDRPMSAEAFEALLDAGHVYQVDVQPPSRPATVFPLPRAN
ncbi:MAG TPA: EAL domain-containing protein, partial [Actinomycetes bacterium]|nr:EAL domain-containing protein [Actinomycetes bacterium]